MSNTYGLYVSLVAYKVYSPLGISLCVSVCVCQTTYFLFVGLHFLCSFPLFFFLLVCFFVCLSFCLPFFISICFSCTPEERCVQANKRQSFSESFAITHPLANRQLRSATSHSTAASNSTAQDSTRQILNLILLYCFHKALRESTSNFSPGYI